MWENSQAEKSGKVCLPVPKKLQGHKGEYEHTKKEQEEDVEDVRQGVPDASESPSNLGRQKLHFTYNKPDYFL
jgi:hypothetical protein